MAVTETAQDVPLTNMAVALLKPGDCSDSKVCAPYKYGLLPSQPWRPQKQKEYALHKYGNPRAPLRKATIC